MRKLFKGKCAILDNFLNFKGKGIIIYDKKKLFLGFEPEELAERGVINRKRKIRRAGWFRMLRR